MVLTDEEKRTFDFHLGQLRHLFMQMIRPDTNKMPEQAAKGLLHPAIKALENLRKTDP